MSMLAVALPVLLLAFRLILDFAPLFPFNDVSKKTYASRKQDFIIHYVPLALASLLNVTGNWLASFLALAVGAAYLWLYVKTWWVPYFRGGPDSRKLKWERLYGHTHRFLPPIKDHLVPDTAHVMIGVLAAAWIVVNFSLLMTADSGTARKPAATPAAAVQEQKPLTIESAFTMAGEKPEQLLMETMQTAKSSLDIAINAINHEEIVLAILEARIRGVVVRVIADRAESANPAQRDKLNSLLAAGIPVKENSRKGLMDLRMAIIDDTSVVTGSFNYTANAASNNDEVLVVLRDGDTAKKWKAQFEAMWSDTLNFRDMKSVAVTNP